MPAESSDDRYAKAVIVAVADLSERLGKVREEIREDMARLLADYRQDVHRTTMAIHIRIVSLEDTIETDRAARIERQEWLAAALAAIQRNQRLWIRVVIVLALVAVGVGIGIWVW